MKIYLATDHSGLTLKEYIKEKLIDEGKEVEDCGAYALNPNDDYPDFIKIAARGVSESPTDKAVIIGGSGQGENMVANKFKNVRSALFYSTALPVGAIDITGKISDDPFEIVKLSRIHNDANVLSLGARFLTKEDAFNAVKIFLETEFLNEERHKRRIQKMETIEKNE